MPVRFDVQIIEAPPMAIVARSYFLAAERYDELLDPMFESMGLVAEQIRQNFETESSGGESWQDWSFWYKLKRGPKDTVNPMGEQYQTPSGIFKWRATAMSQKILQLSGNLMSVATSEASWDIDMQGNAAVAVMEGVPSYGFAHITGSSLINLPVRDWSFVPDDVLDEMDQKFFDHFDEPLET